jgi:hypothetical protein
LRSVAKFIRESLAELIGNDDNGTHKRRQFLMDDEESLHLPLEMQPLAGTSSAPAVSGDGSVVMRVPSAGDDRSVTDQVGR